MAGYYFRNDGNDRGPVAFRELVQMVRNNELTVDTPVKADWEFDWHPAAEVVGLFHMAGRDDVLAVWEAEQKKKVETTQPEVESDSNPVIESRYQGGPLHTTGTPASGGWTMPSESLADSLGEPSLNDVSTGAGKQEKGRVRRLAESLFSQDGLKGSLRWGIAFLLANLTGYGIVSWAERELSRFPGEINTATTRIFPMWGPCSHMEFAFLLFDAVIIGGGIGYLLANVLLAMADD